MQLLQSKQSVTLHTLHFPHTTFSKWMFCCQIISFFDSKHWLGWQLVWSSWRISYCPGSEVPLCERTRPEAGRGTRHITDKQGSRSIQQPNGQTVAFFFSKKSGLKQVSPWPETSFYVKENIQLFHSLQIWDIQMPKFFMLCIKILCKLFSWFSIGSWKYQSNI